MVTIPVEFREQLGIGEGSLLKVKLLKNGVAFIKMELETPLEVDLYSDEEIKEWMEEDKLDAKTAKKLELLLKKGKKFF
ncbi:MAG: AbrB/MazE/SpoVT family DNA-binding domain-containing protein [Candidatus Gracilibacteria bacterium]